MFGDPGGFAACLGYEGPADFTAFAAQAAISIENERLLVSGADLQDPPERQRERIAVQRTGQLMYELGLTAASSFHLRAVCEPHLQRLVQMTQNTIFLTLRSGNDGVCIDRKEGGHAIRSYTVIGTRRPLGIGAGGLHHVLVLERVGDVVGHRVSAHRHGLAMQMREDFFHHRG